MEFTLQSFVILIVGLMVMGVVLATIPVGRGDTRLKGYKISLTFMALSFVLLGCYCYFKLKLPRELLFIPFFISSHIQVSLLGLAHLNLINLNIVHRKQVALNFLPMVICASLYAIVQSFVPFVRLSSWQILFDSISNPSVIVRILWLIVYIGQILYYAVVFFKEEKKYSSELGNWLSDVPGWRYRLALFSFIGAQLAGLDSVCICLTLDPMWGGLFNLLMLVLYAFMCILFVQYPSIFFQISGLIGKSDKEDMTSARVTPLDWEEMKEIILSEKLYLKEGLTVDQLATSLKVSKNVLSRSINNNEGVNFNTYIGRLRIAEAQEIMKRDSEISLLDLAMKVGFSEQSNFSRQFKSITGFTPGAFRKSILSADSFDSSEQS
ncbi:MAG: AraC family transcriptional regulator [Bacteroidales bacterium]|nr:AraC family transcriptional regulator [Bacteroidales bacterium]